MERKETDEKEDKRGKEKEKKEEREKENAKDKNTSQAVEKGKEVKHPIKGVNKTNKEKRNKVIIINGERNSGRKNIKLHSSTFLKQQAINTDQSQKIILDLGGTKFHTCNRTLKTLTSAYFQKC